MSPSPYLTPPPTLPSTRLPSASAALASANTVARPPPRPASHHGTGTGTTLASAYTTDPVQPASSLSILPPTSIPAISSYLPLQTYGTHHLYPTPQSAAQPYYPRNQPYPYNYGAMTPMHYGLPPYLQPSYHPSPSTSSPIQPFSPISTLHHPVTHHHPRLATYSSPGLSTNLSILTPTLPIIKTPTAPAALAPAPDTLVNANTRTMALAESKTATAISAAAPQLSLPPPPAPPAVASTAPTVAPTSGPALPPLPSTTVPIAAPAVTVSAIAPIAPSAPTAPTAPAAPASPAPLESASTTLRTSRDEDDSPPPSPNPRAEKRRRTRTKPSNADKAHTPSTAESPASPHTDTNANPAGSQPTAGGQRKSSGLAPIKPGFAASRADRRGSGNGGNGAGDHPAPSPVVMGFNFAEIDQEQLKTVRDTIGIRQQQEALIAARRRDVAASQPNTPKELTFKGWQPKDPERLSISSGGVGRRREKTRDKVERMSIVTGGPGDVDVVPGSKSAPLGQGLSVQQRSPRDPSTGALTGIPYSHHANGLVDPRTAPISHLRGGRGDEHDFSRQQVPVTGHYYRRHEPIAGHGRSVTEGGARHTGRLTMPSSSARHDDRMLPPSATSGRNGHPGPSATYAQGGSGGGGGGNESDGSQSPPSANARLHPPSHNPTGHPPMSARREAFLAPYNQIYDLLHQTDSLRFALQDLLHRYEGAYANQNAAMGEFKVTATNATTLLSSLQQSADSLKEMVRYEVGKMAGKDKKEVEELRERIKKLEEKLGEKGEVASK